MAITAEQRLRAIAIHKKNRNILAESARMVKEAGAEPAATVGVLVDGFPAWEANKAYAQNEVFAYDGKVGFARQALTSSSVYPPFSAGTEALYGVRPAPDEDGVYPYVYNMAVTVGMRVRDGETVYRCIQPANPLLYAPASVPALFAVEEETTE